MSKSATDVMQDILFAAIIDGVVALKAASKGLPNTLLRDLNAIHANTTFADLPAELQAAIQTSVRAALTRLLKEGYAVTPAGSTPPVRREGSPGPRHPGGNRGPRPGGSGPRGPRSGPGGGRPGGSGRPPRPKS